MPTLAVLADVEQASVADPAWGLSICLSTGLGSGTVYPILERLSDAGWVTSTVESGPHPGRPARRFYQLTDAGRDEYRRVRAEREAKRSRSRGSGRGTWLRMIRLIPAR